MTIDREYARSDKWALTARWDPGGGGAGITEASVLAESLPSIRGVSEEIIVDGISIVYVSVAAGRVIRPQVLTIPTTSTDELFHALTHYTTALTIDNRHYSGLSIPTLLTPAGTLIYLSFTAAANGDSLIVSAWGSYTKPERIQPVDVKSVRFFPAQNTVVP